MDNFKEIVLLPNELKILRKISRSKSVYEKYESVKTLYQKGLIKIHKDFSFSSDKENLIIISDKGKRFLLWSKKNFVKTYFPILISFIALGISLTHLLLQIIGVI